MDGLTWYLKAAFWTPATSSAPPTILMHWHLVKLTVDARYYWCLPVPLSQSGALGSGKQNICGCLSYFSRGPRLNCWHIQLYKQRLFLFWSCGAHIFTDHLALALATWHGVRAGNIEPWILQMTLWYIYGNVLPGQTLVLT